MTAVEFLSEQIRLTNIEGLRFKLWDAIEQAKEMERQQKDEFAIGFGEWLEKLHWELYYNTTAKELLEIYKKEKGL